MFSARKCVVPFLSFAVLLTGFNFNMHRADPLYFSVLDVKSFLMLHAVKETIPRQFAVLRTNTNFASADLA